MKRLILLMITTLVIAGCRNDRSRIVLTNLADDPGQMADTMSYPLIIEGGTKIVYQFGHLTSDKGLKLYFDTVAYPAEGMELNDSLRWKLAPKDFQQEP